MKILLDIHVWLWWLLGSDRLVAGERRSLDLMAAAGSTHLSAMSLWEAQMLSAKGRLTLDRPFQTWLQEAASPSVVQIMPLAVSTAILPTG